MRVDSGASYFFLIEGEARPVGTVTTAVVPNLFSAAVATANCACTADELISGQPIFRSTSKSRGNNIRGGRNVRPYVRPSTKSFLDFNEIWYIGRGR